MFKMCPTACESVELIFKAKKIITLNKFIIAHRKATIVNHLRIIFEQQSTF